MYTQIQLLGALSLILLCQGCGAETLQSSSGYKPPKATAKVVKALLSKTLDDMVFVKGGEFTMGCDLSNEDLRANIEKNEPQVIDFLNSPKGKMTNFTVMAGEETCSPRHKVSLDSYSIAKFEVSFKEYDIFTQEAGLPFLKGWYLRVKNLLSLTDLREGDKGAITGWNQAQRYCAWLKDKTGLNFSLPTEAQWEFAATSRGRYMPFATNTGYYDLGVNYYVAETYRSAPPTEENDNVVETDAEYYKVNVAQYPPNPLGVYNMSGSMIEWVQDWYDPDYYKSSPGKNPKGPKTGETKVLRGGGGLSPPSHTVWRRYGKPILISKVHAEYLQEKYGEDRKVNREDASVSSNFGMRCALNHPTPVSATDLKIQ